MAKMNRLKFLVFALIVLGLWGYHLLQVSPAMGEQSQAAAASVVGAPHAVALKVESQRSELQAAVLKLAASPAVWNMGPKPGAKVEPPSIDRFALVRPVVMDALSQDNKGLVVLALVNEAGALLAQGSAEPGSPPEGFALQALIEAGATGAVATFNGAQVLFYATPLLISDKNEVRAGGAALVGLPLLPDAKALEAILKAQGLTGLAVASDGKVVVNAGDAAATTAALGALKPNATGAVSTGFVRTLGPFQLPLLVGAPALSVGARQAIAGTQFEVVATAAASGPVKALAAYQVFALAGLAGLGLLTIVFALLMKSGGGEEEGAHMVMPPPLPVPAPAKRAESSEPPPLAVPEAPAPEGSPDDFDFPSSGPSAVHSTGTPGQAPAFSSSPAGQAPAQLPPAPEPPEADPFANMAPPPAAAPSYPPSRVQPAPPPPPPARQPPSPPSAAASKPPPPTPFDDDAGARTVAYPAFKPPAAAAPPVADPFAFAASQEESSPSYEDSPDATRVAAVPQELIKQARSGASGVTSERPALRPPTASLPKVQAVAPVGAVSEEERHFQEVFRDFIATREKCGEPADGLTFDKFKAKLLKNKEQLVAKYQCRTVRFQVYVKDGKAALKATPIKD
jgi:hypothetical protein